MFEFTRAERDLLLELLQHQINPLMVEINRTDDLSFKEHLRRRRRLLEEIVAKLQGAQQAAVPPMTTASDVPPLTPAVEQPRMTETGGITQSGDITYEGGGMVIGPA